MRKVRIVGTYSKALSEGRINCTMREEKSTAQIDT